MKKLILAFNSLFLITIAFISMAHAQDKKLEYNFKRVELPAIGMSMSIPEDYDFVAKDQKISDSIPEERRKYLLEDQKNMLDSDYAIALKADETVKLKISYKFNSGKKDFSKMTDEEFDELFKKLGVGFHEIKFVSIKKYTQSDLVFAKRILNGANTYYIDCYTVVGGNEYWIWFTVTADNLSDADNADLKTMVDCVILSPPDKEPEKSLEDVLTPEGYGAPGASKPVEIKEFSLSFSMPASFTGIYRDDDLEEIPGQWQEFYKNMQLKMKDAGVYYYALRSDGKKLVKQMAVIGRDADLNAVQTFLDAGKSGLDKLLSRDNNRRSQKSETLADKVYVSDVVFEKKDHCADTYDWVEYVSDRSDLAFAFVYASDRFSLTASDESDMNRLIQSFH